jgi:sulfofructose kinase
MAAYDITFLMPAFPRENGKYAVAQILETGGGPAANAAYLLASWGIPTAFAGAVGDDAYAVRLLREFQSAGVDVSLLQSQPDTATALAAIAVNTGRGTRTVLSHNPRRPEFSLGAEDLERLHPRLLLLDGHAPAASRQALARWPQAISILDAGSCRPATRELFPLVTHAVCSEEFSLEYVDLPHLRTRRQQAACISALFAQNKRHVAVTRGERSLLYSTDGRLNTLQPPAVKAIDTTAAGDIFHGALAYALLEKMTFAHALQFAAGAASLSVQKPGGRASIPILAEVENVFKNYCSTPG